LIVTFKVLLFFQDQIYYEDIKKLMREVNKQKTQPVRGLPSNN
jgi:hypothetical protein